MLPTPRYALLIAALVLAPTALAQDALTFDSLVHEFGSVPEGEQATHVFAFTNTGAAPLTLTEVQTSCGCTTPEYTTDAVAPGESGSITVVYDSQGRPGPFTKRITVRAGDAAVALQIRGTVVPGFAAGGVAQGALLFDTDAWESTELDADALLQHSFRFQNTGERPIRITEARSPRPGVEIVAPERIVFPGDVAAVVVTVEAPADLAAADGSVDVPVILVTSDEAMPTKSLRLLGRMKTGG